MKIIYKILFLILIISSCKNKNNDLMKPEDIEGSGSTGSSVWTYGPEILDFASKAEAGDPQSAYKLYELFTYSFNKRNYGLAFFWALRANELEHPLVDDALIESAKRNVMAEFLHDHELDKNYRVEPGLLPK